MHHQMPLVPPLGTQSRKLLVGDQPILVLGYIRENHRTISVQLLFIRRLSTITGRGRTAHRDPACGGLASI